uniref:COMM domain-containing protein 1 n=2 Tax=Amazona TaxID=12929 RepID=A0A8B9G1A1_9PSIT
MGTARILLDWISQQPLGESLVNICKGGSGNHRVAEIFSSSFCLKLLFAEEHAELALTNNLVSLGPTCAVTPKDDESCFCSLHHSPRVAFLFREGERNYTPQRCTQQSIASADMDLNQLEAFLTAQTKKQGGITSDQAAVIAKFWKNHRMKIHESLISQSRWDNVLKNMNWRVDLKSQSRHIDQINTPVAIVEMELGKTGQESEFLCLEFDEAKVSQMLKKLSEIEESMNSLTQTT